MRIQMYLHSKSPESDTTTVPDCLSWSRELDIVMVDGLVVVEEIGGSGGGGQWSRFIRFDGVRCCRVYFDAGLTH